jgi:hypothetical protein
MNFEAPELASAAINPRPALLLRLLQLAFAGHPLFPRLILDMVA